MDGGIASVRLSELLHLARRRDASDVHLRPGASPALRIDGILETTPSAAVEQGEMDALLEELLDVRARGELSVRGESTTTYRCERSGSVRVHAFRTSGGYALALRLLAERIPEFDALELPASAAGFALRPHGLAIVAGPTGSGKSTALAALVDGINRTEFKHVVTIEDPIEYEHRPIRATISQREIGRDAPSYEAAVHGALRSDPDVILLGEMREPSTMQAALTAAETGHLVLTTLHTGDASQTIDRILGSVEPSARDLARIQLAQCLVGVLCLRLLPRADRSGRVAAAEVLVATDAVRALIRDGKTHQLRNAIATGRQLGMQTFEAHLERLTARGTIAPGVTIAR